MIIEYSEKYESQWDKFVLQDSMNGTFLQTRSFLNYHPKNRFVDNSLIFMKGTNIIAVLPANLIEDGGRKILFSHMGSTFGGIVLGKAYKKISNVEMIFAELEDYFLQNNIVEVHLKMTSEIYSSDFSELLDYFSLLNHYTVTGEMGYYIDLTHYTNANKIEENFTASRRRDYRYSLKNNLEFKEIDTSEEIENFYSVLCNNMEKFHTKPVHSLEELLLLKERCIPDNIRFYAIIKENEIISGGMIFCFGNKVFHTQYLATNQDYLALYPNEFLYYNLIKKAIEDNFKYISFGTATLEHGKILNKSLAQFKEGFGTREFMNRSYHKKFDIEG